MKILKYWKDETYFKLHFSDIKVIFIVFLNVYFSDSSTVHSLFSCSILASLIYLLYAFYAPKHQNRSFVYEKVLIVISWSLTWFPSRSSSLASRSTDANRANGRRWSFNRPYCTRQLYQQLISLFQFGRPAAPHSSLLTPPHLLTSQHTDALLLLLLLTSPSLSLSVGLLGQLFRDSHRKYCWWLEFNGFALESNISNNMQCFEKTADSRMINVVPGRDVY